MMGMGSEGLGKVNLLYEDEEDTWEPMIWDLTNNSERGQ